MNTAAAPISTEKFSFTSSIAADVWSPKPDAKAYEWWYFDALSDDGRDAVVIIFLDNFIFSPRYNRKKVSGSKFKVQSSKLAEEPETLNIKPETHENVPAVAFFYYRDGKIVYRAINEYDANEFSASETEPSCRIGENFFRFESAPYGSGYFISIKTPFRKDCRLEAQFEWLSIECDFVPSEKIKSDDSHVWNLVVPRADVSGKISISGGKAKDSKTVSFRGTGYHDHNHDHRRLTDAVDEWQWGRAHFSDASAVYYRYKERGTNEIITKLFTILDSELRTRNAEYEQQQLKRDIFGIKYPQRLTFLTEDNVRLRVKQTKVIDASFFYLRFLSEMTLTLRDGKPRKAVGITEYLNPKALKNRFFDWMIDMRIGRHGKSAILR